jgi:hypothetical protein
MKPIILCCGANGRAVIYGRVESEPVPGEPVELHGARMVIYWAGPAGLFGLAAKGPAGGSRLTHAVSRTTETVWQEWIAIEPDAAEKIDAWPAQ